MIKSVLLVLLTCSFLISGCGRVATPVPVQVVEPGRKVHSDSKTEIPFTLDIQKEWNDGGRLYVAGQVLRSAGFDSSQAILRLRTFNAGEITGETLQELVEHADPASGAGLPFVMTIPFDSLSDYQLELLWGKDATPYLDKIRTKESQSVVEVRSVRLQAAACETEDCQQSHVVEAELYNSSTQVVNVVTLGVVLFRTSDQTGVVNAEEELEISGLDLQPGASRNLRLLIDQPVPETIQPLLQPVLRVVSYSSQ